jgi:hypothetical protein
VSGRAGERRQPASRDRDELAEAMGNVESLISHPHIKTSGEGDRFWER